MAYFGLVENTCIKTYLPWQSFWDGEYTLTFDMASKKGSKKYPNKIRVRSNLNDV